MSFSAYFGFGAPVKRPPRVGKLNREINAGLTDLQLKAQLADLGGTILAGSPASLRKADRRRNREVGQGDPDGGHQRGMSSLGACRIWSFWPTSTRCNSPMLCALRSRRPAVPNLRLLGQAPEHLGGSREGVL